MQIYISCRKKIVSRNDDYFYSVYFYFIFIFYFFLHKTVCYRINRDLLTKAELIMRTRMKIFRILISKEITLLFTRSYIYYFQEVGKSIVRCAESYRKEISNTRKQTPRENHCEWITTAATTVSREREGEGCLIVLLFSLSLLSRNPSVLFPRNFSRVKKSRAILGEARRCESEPAWKIYRRTRGEHRGSQTRDLAINPDGGEAKGGGLFRQENSSLRPSVLYSTSLSLSLSLSFRSPRARRRAMDRRDHETGENYFAMNY